MGSSSHAKRMGTGNPPRLSLLCPQAPQLAPSCEYTSIFTCHGHLHALSRRVCQMSTSPLFASRLSMAPKRPYEPVLTELRLTPAELQLAKQCEKREKCQECQKCQKTPPSFATLCGTVRLIHRRFSVAQLEVQ